jgi:hypothetical protein
MCPPDHSVAPGRSLPPQPRQPAVTVHRATTCIPALGDDHEYVCPSPLRCSLHTWREACRSGSACAERDPRGPHRPSPARRTRGSGRCSGAAGRRSGRPGLGMGVGPFAWVPADLSYGDRQARRSSIWRASREGGQSAADDPKGKAKRSHSLPLLTYSALGGLRQDPGRAAESSAGPRTDEDMGATTCVCLLSTDGGRGAGSLGLAGRLRALGTEVRMCAPPDWAERPADSSGGRQREMRTCRTRGSTLRETPVIRPVGAGQRSTAALEVSR